MTTTLQCPECGQDLFEADADGQFWEDTEATCQECGTKCRIGVDDDRAYVHTDDEVEDIGQPRCDGSCGAGEEFRGKPCLWTCDRSKAWKAARKVT